MSIFDKIFGTYSDRELKRIRPIADKVMALEDDMAKLSDAELKAKTPEFKERLKNGETLDDLLPEAFAVMREASWRVLGMKHFYVQVIGGIILHQGRIAEMKTGEGKTLVATLPVYLNALTGEGVHVITVNDYLAKRDSEWMGNLYRFLGLSVGLVIAGMNPKQKQEAYACDVTYGTNNEFGFDYLRDNMVIYKNQLVQRKLKYAIVDEIDSILIDEARTPLIISGRGAQSSNLYQKADHFVKKLQAKVIIEEDDKDYEQEEDNEKYDYIVDLKAKSATLTQQGIKKAEQEFGLENFNDLENSELVHDVNQALHANGIMKKDKDYIVKDGQVLIVDEFTGRIMYGRRYNDGLHQAIEAKEHVKINDESKTLATITFQNYFRMYEKLSGMTGTAMTEEAEFQEIYKLDVVEIPTNKPMIRKDNSDIIYKNEDAKFRAVIADIKKAHEKGQPVLIGTVSIDKSEKLSKLLDKEGIPHEVLNAKYHEKEAQIIAQAGKFGAVTIATNMAGRGTDIMLGGNSEYLAKQEMRKLKYTDEEIEDAAAHNETDDKAILSAREKFNELEKKFDNEIKEEKEKVTKQLEERKYQNITYDMMKRTKEELYRLEHSLTYYMLSIKKYLETQNQDEVYKIIDSYIERVSNVNIVIYTGNDLFDLSLTTHLSQMSSKVNMCIMISKDEFYNHIQFIEFVLSLLDLIESKDVSLLIKEDGFVKLIQISAEYDFIDENQVKEIVNRDYEFDCHYQMITDQNLHLLKIKIIEHFE